MSAAADPTPEGWWADLRATALVGTARRPAPPTRALAGLVPVTEGRATEQLVLDAVAVVGAGRAAGLHAARLDHVPPPAPDDARPVASPTAVQLLELLVGHSPAAGAHREQLLHHWYETCAASGHRVPESMLVALLDEATVAPARRDAARAVVGERGRWLAVRNPAWAWAAGPTPGAAGPADLAAAGRLDAEAWARLPAGARTDAVRAWRARDPAGARALVESTWSSDAATARAAHLGALAEGLGPDDEGLLERALDDRAKSVREVAIVLLDGLPTSARATRMAERLRPLVSVAGRLRGRAVTVELPAEPDESGVRDGLGTAPAARSRRGWWLERIVAGTPLPFWRELTGEDAAVLDGRIEDDDVRRGLLAATLAQRDPEWSAALFGRIRDPRLLAATSPDERDALIVAALAAPARHPDLSGLLAAVPPPWSPALGAAVIDLVLDSPFPAAILQNAGALLAEGLDDTAVHRLEIWLAELKLQESPPVPLSTAIRAVLQHRSLHRSITEAFT